MISLLKPSTRDAGLVHGEQEGNDWLRFDTSVHVLLSGSSRSSRPVPA